MQDFASIADLRARCSDDKPFAEAVRHGSMLAELYAPRGEDLQKPHAQDELYIVHRGEGVFVKGGERRRFAAGDVIFVGAGVAHRFEDFSEDFETWAIFYGPQGGESKVDSADSIAIGSPGDSASSAAGV